MRITRKLTLLATMAIAATALAAPSAFAQTEPLAHNQTPRLIVQQEVHAANDVGCPLVTPSPPVAPPALPPVTAGGGCRAHVTSGATQVVWSFHLSAGGTEVAVGSCTIEFDIRIDAAGEGYMTHQEMVGPAATCPRRACGQLTPPTSEGRIWSLFIRETEPAPRETVTFLFCTEALDGTGASHCEFTLPVSQPTAHRYRWTATDASGHGAIFPHCEWDGIFDVEATPGVSGEGLAEQNIEIRHT